MGAFQAWPLEIDIDAVLRGQGADPNAIRARNPRLVDLAELALEEAEQLLQPRAYIRRFEVAGLRHELLELENGLALQGRLIGQHLARAEEVVAILATIGDELEEYASELSSKDLLHALAVDGVGSAATEALANAVCAHVEHEARAEGQETTIPLSPGMEGWSVDRGQPQIFALFKDEEISITLRPTGLMLPRKSLSMVLGVGQDVVQSGSTCDYCSMRETCRYQDHYAKEMTS
jgi:hypothetical protein